MRRQPTLIGLTDSDVQDVRLFLEAQKKDGAVGITNGVAAVRAQGPANTGASPEMVINDFSLEAEMTQAADELASGP